MSQLPLWIPIMRDFGYGWYTAQQPASSTTLRVEEYMYVEASITVAVDLAQAVGAYVGDRSCREPRSYQTRSAGNPDGMGTE